MEPADQIVSAPYKFRGSDYYLTMEVKGNNSVMIEVEDRLSADQWRDTFDSTYLESITQKTGNFKQFSVFVSMLESAVTQSSKSVCLDLLTWDDLQALREKKNNQVKSTIPASRNISAGLTSKRYLIVTYTVEFDRIHYPIPLPYAGKPDPRALQDEIRQLRNENTKLKQGAVTDFKSREYEKLLRDYKKLVQEKQDLEEEFLQYRRELKNTASGNAAKEIRTLKSVVRNLEQELMREKTEHQRSTSKRGQDYRELLEEVEELRASERNLRVRVKSLTNELAMYKRGRQPSRTSSRERGPSLNRSAERRNRSNSRQSSFSRERSAAYSRQLRERSLSQDRLQFAHRRDRSSSRDRPSSAPTNRRPESPASLRGSFNSIPRSPSPAGPKRRFDPTGYIKEQERRKKEASLKKKRRERSNVSGTSNSSRPSPGSFNSSRHSSYLRTRSRTSSFGSQGELSDGGMSDGSYTSSARLRNFNYSNRTRSSPQATNGTVKNATGMRSKVYPLVQTSVHDEDSPVYNRTAEINEIDERLNRLQQLMKASMP